MTKLLLVNARLNYLCCRFGHFQSTIIILKSRQNFNTLWGARGSAVVSGSPPHPLACNTDNSDFTRSNNSSFLDCYEFFPAVLLGTQINCPFKVNGWFTNTCEAITKIMTINILTQVPSCPLPSQSPGRCWLTGSPSPSTDLYRPECHTNGVISTYTCWLGVICDSV